MSIRKVLRLRLRANDSLGLVSGNRSRLQKRPSRVIRCSQPVNRKAAVAANRPPCIAVLFAA
jgi:hypothetical protein